jgi:hypothetical protein
VLEPIVRVPDTFEGALLVQFVQDTGAAMTAETDVMNSKDTKINSSFLEAVEKLLLPKPLQ